MARLRPTLIQAQRARRQSRAARQPVRLPTARRAVRLPMTTVFLRSRPTARLTRPRSIPLGRSRALLGLPTETQRRFARAIQARFAASFREQRERMIRPGLPRRTTPCSGRRARRRTIFALGVAGRSGGAYKAAMKDSRYTLTSRFSCR